MSRPFLDVSLSPSGRDAHARRIDLAQAEALRLRQEAIRDFGVQTFANVWREADEVWQRLETRLNGAARSAQRLQARMGRRSAATRAA